MTKNQAHKYKVSSFQATSARRKNCYQSDRDRRHVGGHSNQGGQQRNLIKVAATNHGLVTALDARGSEGYAGILAAPTTVESAH